MIVDQAGLPCVAARQIGALVIDLAEGQRNPAAGAAGAA